MCKGVFIETRPIARHKPLDCRVVVKHTETEMDDEPYNGYVSQQVQAILNHTWHFQIPLWPFAVYCK